MILHNLEYISILSVIIQSPKVIHQWLYTRRQVMNTVHQLTQRNSA